MVRNDFRKLEQVKATLEFSAYPAPPKDNTCPTELHATDQIFQGISVLAEIRAPCSFFRTLDSLGSENHQHRAQPFFVVETLFRLQKHNPRSWIPDSALSVLCECGA